MNEETKKLLNEIKEYRKTMVARNLPFQLISDIITKWEMKKTTSEQSQNELEPIYDEYNRDTTNDPFKGTSIEGKD